MRRIILLLVLLSVVCVVRADYSVQDEGAWPKTWPAELDRFRKTSRTYEEPLAPQFHYEIPFIKRNEFEDAWPHILKVKGDGGTLILTRAPYTSMFKLKAGVVVHCPAAGAKDQANRVVLVVDGDIVDLNRIEMPRDTKIIDKRFDKE